MADPKYPTCHLIITTFVVSVLICFPASYQGSIINIPETVFEQFENSSFVAHFHHKLSRSGLATLWGLTAASSGIGCLISAPLIPLLTRIFGRRKVVFYFGASTTCIGSLIQMASFYAKSFELFIFGQMVCAGIGWTFAYGVGTVYLTECCPPQQRGMIATFISVSINIATLVAYVLGLPNVIGTAIDWPCYVSWPALLSFLGLISMKFCRESPKHLYIFRGEVEKAKKSIRNYYGENFKADDAFADFREEVSFTNTSSVTFKELMTVRHLRKPMLISCVAGIFNQLCGTTVISLFSASIFKEIHLSEYMSDVFSVVMYIPMVLFTILSSLVVDRWGRRPLFLGGGMAMIALLLMYVVMGALAEFWNRHTRELMFIGVGSILLNQWIASLGPGPVASFLFSEINPQTAMSLVTTMLIVTNNIAYIIVSFAFPPLQDAFGYWSILVTMVVPSVACWIYLLVEMPETKNLPVNAIVGRWTKTEENDTDALIREVTDEFDSKHEERTSPTGTDERLPYL